MDRISQLQHVVNVRLDWIHPDYLAMVPKQQNESIDKDCTKIDSLWFNYLHHAACLIA